MFYSSAKGFIDSLFEKHILDWPKYTKDFFPLLTDKGEYWSGYYSTDV